MLFIKPQLSTILNPAKVIPTPQFVPTITGKNSQQEHPWWWLALVYKTNFDSTREEKSSTPTRNLWNTELFLKRRFITFQRLIKPRKIKKSNNQRRHQSTFYPTQFFMEIKNTLAAPAAGVRGGQRERAFRNRLWNSCTHLSQ